MQFTSWLDVFRNRGRVTRRRRPQAAYRNIETLEERALLSVTSLFVGSELSIISDADDSITIRQDPLNPGVVQVLANGAPATTLSGLRADSVTTIVVRGGNEANTIDLAGVTANVFSSVTNVRIDGGNGNDVIIGSIGLANNILGGDGDDTLTGGNADDTIDGDDGNDEISGGLGNDRIIGEDGDDLLNGNDGDDTLDAGDGFDTANGNGGNDSLLGDDGPDILNGNDGNDIVNGGSGNDSLFGNDGSDTMFGGGGDDSLVGGADNDSLNGNAGDDRLEGGDGADSLTGGANRDSLLGGNGNDTLNGNSGLDTLTGGDGDDTLFGGGSADSLVGNAGDDFIKGQAGNDTLIGGLGQDMLNGGAGDDLLESAQGLVISDVTIDPEGDGGVQNSTVFFTDFNTGVPPEISGVTNTEPVQGFAGIGTVVNTFTGDFLRNATGGDVDNPGSIPQVPTRLTLTQLPEHTSIDLNFLFAVINSWDGIASSAGPDFFNVVIDGVSIFRENFRNLPGLQGYNPPSGVLITPRPFGELGFSPDINEPDSAYNLGLDPIFDDINHSSSTLTIEWFADGAGFEGDENESWAIDNLEVILNGTPVTRTAVFDVDLPSARSNTVTVDFATSDGTATAGLDYQALNGTLTFNPGQTRQQIRIPVIGDTLVESNENFFVNLTNVDGATITDAQGEARIIDDDGAGTAPIPLPTAAFDIVLNFTGGLSASQQIVFRLAEQRLEQIITADVPDVFVPTVGLVDDILINASAISIDGFGGVLAQAGPEHLRSDSFLPATGEMQFDTADMALLEGNGQLFATVLHEMIHVLGFGTIWQDLGLLSGAGTADPRFIGVQATSEYNARFGLAQTSVPVENQGGFGTADSHWRESVFTTELMTGTLDGGVSNPLSRMSIASLADLGYTVDLGQADLFVRTTLLQSIQQRVNTLGTMPVLNLNKQMVTPANVGPWLGGSSGGKTAPPADTSAGSSGTTGGSDDTSKTDSGGTSTGSGDETKTDSTPLSKLVSGESQSTGNALTTAKLISTIGFDELPPQPVEGLTFSGVTFDYRIDSVESNDAMYNSTGPGSLTFVQDPTLIGNSAGVLTLNFATPVVSLEFGIARNVTTIVSPGVVVELFDDNLVSLGVFPINLIPLVGNSEGQFVYAGAPASRAVLDFTVASTALGGDEFAIDNLIFDDGIPAAPAGISGDTLMGGTGDDTIRGGNGDDVLNGGAGDDSLDGGAGSDTLYGGAGDDTLDGGPGSDTTFGQGGNDITNGGDGDDTTVWRPGDGSDTIAGDDGSDTVEVRGSSFADTFTLGQSGSNLQVTNGGDTVTIDNSVTLVELNARGANDTINVNDIDGVAAVAILLNGQNGNDIINAGGAAIGDVRLQLDGGNGNDVITGSDGDDTLLGGMGDDMLSAGAGDDTANGGLGDDIITGGDGNDNLLGEDGVDILMGELGDDILQGGNNSDDLDGGEGNDTLSGDNGDDNVNGMQGNDSLLGGAGMDYMYGGMGDDTMDGGTDEDTLIGHFGDDKLRGDHGHDLLDGGEGNDTLNGGDGDDTLLGGAGNDGLHGMDGDDFINAGAGNDTAVGGDGDDSMLGGAGQDILLGGDGDDQVNGQGGSEDTVAGNEGVDNVVGSASEINEAFTLAFDVLDSLNGF